MQAGITIELATPIYVLWDTLENQEEKEKPGIRAAVLISTTHKKN
jgi:hypothetical protein